MKNPEGWRRVAAAAVTALRMKNPDEGIYGKRDWALLELIEAIRDVAVAESAPRPLCGANLSCARPRGHDGPHRDRYYAQWYDSGALAQARHVFVGRADRACEVCGLPDRATVHSVPERTGP